MESFGFCRLIWFVRVEFETCTARNIGHFPFICYWVTCFTWLTYVLLPQTAVKTNTSWRVIVQKTVSQEA